MFLNDALDTHSNILTTYLKEHVFFVPPTAILAVSPLDVPLPAKKDAQSSIESQREVSRNNEGQAELEGGKSDNKSLEEVLTSIHKTEYFLARLKQVHEENDRYLQLLQSILRSMLELDEKTKENGSFSFQSIQFDFALFDQELLLTYFSSYGARFDNRRYIGRGKAYYGDHSIQYVSTEWNSG